MSPEPLSPDDHAWVVNHAIDMTTDEIHVENDYVNESVRRHIDDDGGITLTHALALHDGDLPIEARVNYHLDDIDPARSRVSFSIHSPDEQINIRSNRPKQAIVESDGTVTHMFDPSNPNGTDPRLVELAQFAQGFWSREEGTHDAEEPTYMMRGVDAQILVDLMSGQTTATDPVERNFSGNNVRDTAKNLFLRAKRSITE